MPYAGHGPDGAHRPWPDSRAYARQPARGVEVGGWRVEDWARVQAEGVDVGRACGYVARSLGLAQAIWSLCCAVLGLC